jgi:enoyl-CoA hydratase
MKGASILSEVGNRILKITLNRPERLNILTVETRKYILKILKAHEVNDAVRCVVIASRGEVFSAGADINYLLSLDKRKARSYSRFVRAFLAYLEKYPKPTVGVVSGLAVGGGLELLMTLDFVIATPEARFGQTELNVGLIPGGGGSQRLPRFVGIRKAKEMIYTGGLISAKEAFNVGLVNKVVPKETLATELELLCDEINSKSLANLSLVKKLINEGMTMSPEDALEMESEQYSTTLSSRSAKEGMRAFLQKRGQKEKESNSKGSKL